MAREYALQDAEMVHTDIFSDSQHVVNVIHLLEIGDPLRWRYKIANYDRVSRLHEVWKSGKFRIHKVKSHLDWMLQDTLSKCRISMGNYVADRVATLALKKCPSWMLSLANTMARRFEDERGNLLSVFSYLVDLNLEHGSLDSKYKKPQTVNQTDQAELHHLHRTILPSSYFWIS